MSDRVLVVAAHPDDEVLGVGGTVAIRASKGDDVFALILGEGQTSRWEHRKDTPQDVLENLHKDTLASAEIIGFKDVFFEKFPDNRFDDAMLLDITKVVERVVDEIVPQVIYTHHGGDLNVDHRLTHQAVLTATRPIGRNAVRDVYTFETLSSTEWNMSNESQAFIPNVFVDISTTINRKCRAMEYYKTELCDFPHPRSIEGILALSRYRGSAAGMEYAEAFRLVRSLQR